MGSGAHSFAVDAKQYYHSGGVDGSSAGWYYEDEYFELFRTTIRKIGQGQASIESLRTYGFTEDILLAMVAWSLQAYDYYGGRVPLASGSIEPLHFSSPFFAPGVVLKFLQLSKGKNALVPLGLGSTGRTQASNLVEQLAMKEIMGNPNAGQIIQRMKPLTDPRWSGWRKMQFEHVGIDGSKIIIHYNGKWVNGVLKAVDDFKFK